MADPSRHADSRPTLENLVRKIPGFKGYLAREDRRDSDYLARMQVVDALQKCKAAADRIQRDFVDAGKLDALTQCERIRSRLDLLQSKLKGAMRGYSGFFDFVRVDEELLDQVYVHDLLMLEDAEKILAAIEQLSAQSEPAAALSEVLKRTDELDERIQQRTKMLEGIA